MCNHKPVWDDERGEIACSECGEVLERIINLGPEWRYYGPFEKHANEKIRCGPLLTYTIPGKNLAKTPQEYKNESKRLRLTGLSKRFEFSEKGLSEGLYTINRICEQRHLPSSIREEGCLLYRKIHSKGLSKGRGYRVIASAIVEYLCKKHGIVQNSSLDKKARRLYGILTLEFGPLPYRDVGKNYIQMYANKLAESLGYEEISSVCNLALKIYKAVSNIHLLQGKNRKVTAASILYISACILGKKILQKEIAQVAGVTGVGIRKRDKELIENLDIKIYV